MQGRFRPISRRLADAASADPSLIPALLSDGDASGLPRAAAKALASLPEEVRAKAMAMVASGVGGFAANPAIAEMLGRRREQTRQAESRLRAAGFDASDVGELADIDKSSRSLHELLSSIAVDGSALGMTVFGGAPVGDDLGYGPARVLGADDVARVAAALDRVDPSELAARAAATAAPLPPELAKRLAAMPTTAGFSFGGGDASVLAAFDVVRACYASAAARGFAMLIVHV
jgi:hypothetical protein